MKLIQLCSLTIFGLIIIENVSTAPVENKKSVKRSKRDDNYTTEFDNFDIDSVLQSSRLMKSYIKCLQDKGPCTKEGRELKKNLPDALTSDCSKCSAVQKKQGGKVLSVVLKDYREDWDELVKQYDPEGLFRKKYAYDEEADDDEGEEA